MSKQAIIEEVKQARATFMAAISGLSEEDMTKPGAAGIWSIKDIMGHLVAWEAELVTALSRKLSPRYKDAPHIVKIEDIDDWNAEQYHLNAQRSVQVVMDDFTGVHKHLLLAINDLDERFLEDPLRFEWMEGEPLAYLINEVAVWHEQEHAEDIQLWREQTTQ